MLSIFRRQTRTTTLDLIDAANSHLFALEPLDPEYDETFKKVKALHKIKAKEKPRFNVSPDTLLLVVGNLAGILLIMNHEKLDVISTKALSFIKPKI